MPPSQPRPWTRRLLDVSMRTKVLGITIAMNLLTFALLTWHSSQRMQRVFLDQLALRGRALAGTAQAALEYGLIDQVLTDRS